MASNKNLINLLRNPSIGLYSIEKIKFSAKHEVISSYKNTQTFSHTEQCLRVLLADSLDYNGLQPYLTSTFHY